jgi:hypothetical protein
MSVLSQVAEDAAKQPQLSKKERELLRKKEQKARKAAEDEAAKQ